MKVATILYHKNITSIYKKEWIEKSYKSVLNQSYDNFIIYELNYGDDNYKLYREYPNNKNYHYYKIPFNNHAEAMNFLLEECLNDGIDVVFNNNLDDFSDEKRFEIQLEKIKSGYDIISSNFTHIDKNDIEIRKMKMDSLNIKQELDNNHNLICHPSVCFSRKFIEKNKYITTEIPEEDMKLWKRTIGSFKFFICPEYLINYRIHDNQITSSSVKNDSDLPVKSTPEKNPEPIIFHQFDNRKINNDRCSCGEIKNKLKYNFCQKCNKLY